MTYETYKPKAIIIKTKTNLHVGSGDMNYNIIDKTVQRDSISNLPIINASSLKGALRNHFDEVMADENRLSKELLDFIFGKEDDDTPSQGYVKFLDSYLLFLPLRATHRPFYHVTSRANLLAMCDFYKTMDFDMTTLKEEAEKLDENKDIVLDKEDTDIEEILCKASENKALSDELTNLFGVTNVAIFSDKNFIEACDYMPIIARNKIATKKENGEVNDDSNLWYEEIVPRESIFYTAQLDYSNYGNRVNAKNKNTLETFYSTLQQGHIQVGANASVGFGLCKFTEILKQRDSHAK